MRLSYPSVSRPVFVLNILLTLAVAAHAQAIPIDDFNDGNDDGWTHHNYTPDAPWAPGVWDASSMAYNIKTSGVVEVDGLGTLYSTWDASNQPVFTNGYLRAKVTANSSSLPFIFMRAGLPLDFEERGIQTLIGARPDIGNFVAWRENAEGEVLAEFFPAPWRFNRDEEWFFELGAVGNLFTAKVWPVDEQEPVDPQWTSTDLSPAAGSGIGVGSWLPLGLPADEISVTFDDIVFIVPEPTSALLVGLGWLGLVACRRKRTS